MACAVASPVVELAAVFSEAYPAVASVEVLQAVDDEVALQAEYVAVHAAVLSVVLHVRALWVESSHRQLFSAFVCRVVPFLSFFLDFQESDA